MKFKFSLDPVLKVRQHQEKLQKQELAEELLKRKEIDDLRATVQEKLHDYLRGDDLTKASRLHLIRRRGRHMEQVHQTIGKLERELGEAEENVGVKRKILEETHKKRQLLEKVKEKEYERFNHQVEVAEQRQLDEIATHSFGR